MGNIPDNPKFKEIIGDLVGKYKFPPRPRPTLTCQYCLKSIEVDVKKHPFVIRKGHGKWYFCGYDCQVKFRKEGVYGPTRHP